MKMIMIAGFLLFLASNSEAACFRNCLASGNATNAATAGPVMKTMLDQPVISESQHSSNREKSHDVANTKNAVIGDMNFKIGHDKMEFSAGNNSQVNASITSIINLGDTVSTGDRHNK